MKQNTQKLLAVLVCRSLSLCMSYIDVVLAVVDCAHCISKRAVQNSECQPVSPIISV
jgi:hypothetical protein